MSATRCLADRMTIPAKPSQQIARAGTLIIAIAIRWSAVRVPQVASSKGCRRRTSDSTCELDRLQVFDKIPFLCVGKPKIEMRVVMLDDLVQRCETSIVVEATFVNFLHVP
jgi:hypothetical protein